MIVSKNGKTKRAYKKKDLAWASRQSPGYWFFEMLAKKALEKNINFLLHKKNLVHASELKRVA